MSFALFAGLAACGGGGDPARPIAVEPVATVTVTPTIREVRIGESVVMQVELKDAAGNVLTGREITWTSSSNAVATVSATGQVAALAPGQATITATSETKTGGATINVPFPVADIVVDAPEFVQIGQTIFINARAVSSTGATLQRPITYSTSNLAVLGVSGSGQVTGLAAGTAVITATAEGKSKDVTITATPVASVVMDYASAFFPIDHSVQLALTGRNATNDVVSGTKESWATSNAAFTISQTGLFRATGFVTNGATITGTLDGKSVTQRLFAFPHLKNNEPQGPFGAPTLNDVYAWVLIMPPPPSRLVLSITGPNGDADLGLYRPSKTEEITAECIPFLDGSVEECDLQDLPGGYWFVVVEPFSVYSGLVIKAVITTPGAPASAAHSTLVTPTLQPLPQSFQVSRPAWLRKSAAVRR